MNQTVQVSRQDPLRLKIVEQASGQSLPESGPATVTISSDGVAVTFEIVD